MAEGSWALLKCGGPCRHFIIKDEGRIIRPHKMNVNEILEFLLFWPLFPGEF